MLKQPLGLWLKVIDNWERPMDMALSKTFPKESKLNRSIKMTMSFFCLLITIKKHILYGGREGSPQYSHTHTHTHHTTTWKNQLTTPHLHFCSFIFQWGQPGERGLEVEELLAKVYIKLAPSSKGEPEHTMLLFWGDKFCARFYFGWGFCIVWNEGPSKAGRDASTLIVPPSVVLHVFSDNLMPSCIERILKVPWHAILCIL